MSGLIAGVLGSESAVQVFVERPAVTWLRSQVAAGFPQWLAHYAPVAGEIWEVLKVREMGERDGYHWRFAQRQPQVYEIRLLVFSSCGSAHYRLDAIGFEADRAEGQWEVVPIVQYSGQAL